MNLEASFSLSSFLLPSLLFVSRASLFFALLLIEVFEFVIYLFFFAGSVVAVGAIVAVCVWGGGGDEEGCGE